VQCFDAVQCIGAVRSIGAVKFTDVVQCFDAVQCVGAVRKRRTMWTRSFGLCDGHLPSLTLSA